MPVPKDPRWRAFARESAQGLRERLDRLATLTEDEREQIARRLEQSIAGALEVPDDLQAIIEESAARLIAQSDSVDPVAIAWERTRERARRTAAIGAVTTVPAVLPGMGTALAALGLVADWRYVAEQQRDLVLEIAALFGNWPENPTHETRNLFLAATATAFGGSGAGKAVTNVLARQVARKGFARLLPGAGAAVAGALNYISTIALGRAAIEYFGTKAGFEVRGLVPENVHTAMPWLRNAVVDAIESDREGDLFSEEANRAMTGLSPAERDELLDLGAALTLARGRDPTDNPLIDRLGSQLGFGPEDVDKTILRAVRSTLPIRERLSELIGRVADQGTNAVQSVWRRVARVARRTKPKPRRKKGSRKTGVRRRSTSE